MKFQKIALVLICLLFLTCKKDPPVSKQATDECDTITRYPIGDTAYQFPRFNPNNSNEIIYVRGSTSSGKTRLVKRNLSTGQETFIVNDVWQMPDWSVKDWIVFNHADNQVWKIKSNGDSLTQLTNNPQGGFDAIWNKTGDKITYWSETGQSGPGANTYYTFVTDASGNIIDTLFYPFQLNFGAAWSYDNTKIASYCYTHDVGCIDLTSKQLTKITNNPQNDDYIINCIDWVPNSQDVIWASENGLYKTNITTQQTIIIKTICHKLRYYITLSISTDGQKIIAQRIDVKSGLCLMDIDGKNEVIIK